MRSERSQKTCRGLVLGLAWSDIRHEWILGVCLVLAIAAVLSPLLLLFGLKEGVIDTMINRLVEDPRNREIRPTVSRTFDQEWFDEVAARSDVSFVIPLTRRIAASVNAHLDGAEGKRVALDLLATRAGDALLEGNQSRIPGENECVLTFFAADELGAKPGDTLIVLANRTLAGRSESVRLAMTIVGVLPVGAGTTKAVYVPLELLEDVEQYRDGSAVPERGWTGSIPRPSPRYNGLALLSDQELAPTQQAALCNNTGFTRIRTLSAEEQRAELGYSASLKPHVYLLYNEQGLGGDNSVQAVRSVLRNRGLRLPLIPWIRPVDALLTIDGVARQVTVRSLSRGIGNEEPSLAPAVPWANDHTFTNGIPLLVGTGYAAPGTRATLEVGGDKGRMAFPVVIHVSEDVGDAVCFLPHGVAGSIRLLDERSVAFSEELNDFILGRSGHAGFRLYARSIYDVDPLRAHFQEMDIPVKTEVEKIVAVLSLRKYLNLIFWLIASVGIAGSAASLLASLYASVERKKRDLAILRLMGLSGGTLFRFPIYQGCILALGGFVVSFGFFSGMAEVINTLFASHLLPGESFCHITLPYALAAAGGTLLMACIAALAAVTRMARIEPAEALRDE